MTENKSGSGSELKMYIAKNMIMGIILAVFVIILVKIAIGLVSQSNDVQTVTPEHQDIVHPKPVEISSQEAQKQQQAQAGSSGRARESIQDVKTKDRAGTKTVYQESAGLQEDASHSPKTVAATATHSVTAISPQKAQQQSHDPDASAVPNSTPKSAPVHEDTQAHSTPDQGHADTAEYTFPVVGMAFVDAVVRPLEYELTRRFYGWRPNDILDVTDNVNNFQLGVLEVTRRSAVILSERISRTGSTASFDHNLQNAMNWLMIKADRYWFPSAESKYKASLAELRTYLNRLEKGEAQFYNRTDNLIPLLMAYQDLLGSCDENLVKVKEDDGSGISYFRADDYFFYAQGVANTLHTILGGIEKDFATMVERRGGMEVLHHAIASCHHAMELDPWIVLNSDLSSVFANHRLNMAGPISHARFYLGVLIKALST